MSVIRARLTEALSIPAAADRPASAPPEGALAFLNADERGGVGPNGKTSLTIDEAAEQITRSGHTWNGRYVTDTPAVVTFAFRSTAPLGMPEDTGGFSRFSEAQIAATLDALAAWSDVANLTFVRVGTGSSGEGAYSNAATMLFGNYSTGADGAAAFAYYPTDTSHGSLAGDVWVNSTLSYNANPVMGGYGVLTLVHEIGHALGLGHPGDYDAGDGGGPITYNGNAEYYEDSHQYTLMSYFTEGNTGGNFGPYYPAAPMLDDIAAAQRLYGANMETRTGDTVYGFNSNAGRAWFEASAGRPPVFAVWDAGGVDTFDFSGYSNVQFIDLRAGHFSSVGGYVGNVAIAQGVTIENAIGGSGSDTFVANAAANRLDGGAGQDTVSYAASDAGVTVRLTTGAGLGGHAQGDVLVSIENLIGSAFKDTLIGSAAANTLTGGEGDDYLDGLAGDDVLNGGAGNDRIKGGAGADILDGGTGTDTLLYNDSDAGVTVRLKFNTAEGGYAQGDTISGFENVVGSRFADTLVGDDGVNVLTGGDGDDYLDGLDGDDTLDGGAGADRLKGGDGFDTATYAGSAAGVTVRLSSGAGLGGDAEGDQLEDIEGLIGSAYDDTLIGSAAANIIMGGDGNDYLDGLDGDDVLDGGAGDDRIAGGAGADVLIGGDGVDLLNYARSDKGVTVRLKTNAVSGGHAEGDIISGFENVQGSSKKDTLIGDNGANLLMGGDGDDYLDGLGGDDVLEGGAGADRMKGGDGVDTATYASSASGVVVRLNTGVGQNGDAEGDTLESIENVIGSRHADVLIGDSGANVLDGGSGADILQGRAGDDVLLGGAGDDILVGGAGADVLDGGSGVDTVDYSGSGGGVVVRLNTGVGQNHEAAGDTYISIENVIGSAHRDVVIGTGGANRIEGGDGDDILYGRGGDDVLLGGEGDDVLAGESGADLLDGGAGVDTVDYSASDGSVVVRLNTGVGQGHHAEGDTFVSIENAIGSAFRDTLIGNSESNRLEGGAGDDILYGRGGDDVLVGGAGDDTLYGEGGADLFLFEGASGHDVIADFQTGGGDRIQLDGALFADFADVMANTSDSGAGAVISKGGVSITLTGVTKAQLQAGHFEFSAGAAAAAATGVVLSGLMPAAELKSGTGEVFVAEPWLDLKPDAVSLWTDAQVAPEAPVAAPMDDGGFGLGRAAPELFAPTDLDWIW